jgi:hypothetical protein
MKPTKEQIEAALRYADFNETNQDLRELHEFAITRVRTGYHVATTCNQILSAAYRELLAENERLKLKKDNYPKRRKKYIPIEKTNNKPLDESR